MGQDARMRIFHVATRADWRAARDGGSYATSTRGRTLAQEGFIHAARRDQVSQVLAAFYSDVEEPLVVLEIETDLLDAEWREDQVGDQTFPHVYGPINANAVVGVRELRGSDVTTRPAPPPVVTAFLGAAFVAGLVAVALLVLALVAHAQVEDGRLPHATSFLVWTMFTAALTTVVGAAAVAAYLRRQADALARTSRG
jgi:uncharacterized protein (DUF952 family)